MTQPNQIELAGAKVLIVDDIPANLKVLREVLEPRGFRILLAPRGDVALRVARSELPDLILLDVMMPEMDGLEVCRRLKSDPSTGHIPVIFITAKDEAEDIVKGLGVGGVDYISKPFQAEVVVARAETHLHNGRLAQALRQRNADLEIARAAAEEAKRAQSAFLAMMSHEIRTPMNSVLGMTALLLETPLGAEQRDFVETIRTGSRSLLGIINEILDFSKIESGRMTLESQPFDLRASVEEVLEILGSTAAEKNLDLAYRPEPGLPAMLVGDTTRLRQILMNLTGNALKFTARGEVVVEARRELTTESGLGSGGVRPSSGAETQDRAAVRDRFGPSNAAPAAAAEDGRTPPNKKKNVSEPAMVALHFSVRDTGIGIPADKQDRLFQPFSQVDSSTTRQYGGTGLGLAISQRLAELMGGRMWVESVPGAGSTFHFVVPFTVPTEPTPSPSSGSAAFAGQRVLIVEDNPTNREILDRLLSESQMQPHGVATADQALEYLKTNPVDLAIIDLELPNGEAFGLAEAMRVLSTARSATLVFLSSNRLPPDDPRLIAMEARAVITKPIRRPQLLGALGRVVDPDQPAQTLPAERAFDPELARRVPLRILLADDHALNQKVGSRILQGFGYSCEIASNGLEVLQALERQPFDLVFLDVQMPELDGYETARRIRQRWSEEQRPRLVAMTANALLGDRERCLEAGMDDYIAKPVEIADLQKALERSGRAARKSTGADPVPGPAAGQVAAKASAVTAREINWARLNQLTDNDPKVFREFSELYLKQSASLLEELRAALRQENKADVEMLAHKCRGASATCGIDAMVGPLGEIEKAGRSGDFSDAPRHLAETEKVFARIRELLLSRLSSPES